MMRIALALGVIQSWFARGYRDATALERICIFPSWLVFRGLFLIAFELVRIRHGQ